MDLHIHCGLHKTASTSFQQYLHQNRKALANAGVMYPQYGDSYQHSALLWEAQKKGIDVVKKYFSSLSDTASEYSACLISSEDLENYLFNTNEASLFEKTALDSGFNSVIWHVVWRPMRDYVNSLYNELSKHDVVIKRKTLELAARERGSFFVSTDLYNYIFVLDYQRFGPEFRKCVSTVKEYEFDVFSKGIIGWPLLQHVISPKRQLGFLLDARGLTTRKNHSASKIRIEISYLLTRFGLGFLKANRLLRKLIFLPPLDSRNFQSKD